MAAPTITNHSIFAPVTGIPRTTAAKRKVTIVFTTATDATFTAAELGFTGLISVSNAWDETNTILLTGVVKNDGSAVNFYKLASFTTIGSITNATITFTVEGYIA